MSRAGFTLIELLIVMVIIAVLASLSIPAINGALSKARFAKSQSNLRQIGTALFLYAQDNDGFFPTAHGAYDFIDNPTNQIVSWAQQLDPYTGSSRKIFFSDYAKSWNPSAGKWEYFLGSHAAGVEALAYGLANFFVPVNLHKIRQPSRHILAGECHNPNKGYDDADMDDYNKNNPGFGYSGKERKVNILFADGHVEAPMHFDATNMAVTYEGITDPPYAGYQ